MSKKSIFETEEFLELQKREYKRLRESGFDDIENPDGSLRADVEPARPMSYDSPMIGVMKSRIVTNRDYYSAAADHVPLCTRKWHEHAWSMYCSGKALREIADTVGVSHTSVHKFVKKQRVFYAPRKEINDGNYRDRLDMRNRLLRRVVRANGPAAVAQRQARERNYVPNRAAGEKPERDGWENGDEGRTVSNKSDEQA